MVRGADNVIQFPGEIGPEVEAAAAAWLVRLTCGSATLGDLAALALWRADSPDHDRAYREMQALWDRSGRVARATGARRHAEPARRPLWSLWTTRLGQIAAVLVMLVLGARYESSWRYDHHTAPGETRRIALPDGSVIFMKGGAALNTRVSSTGPRTVELARGEAFFEVTHDATRPFTVLVGSGTVRDVGTAFSVARAGKSVTVAVEHGEVAVTGASLTESMVAGEQLSFNLYAMGRKRPVDTGLISAWRRGLYVADGKPLGEVLSEIGEHHAGPIIVTSRALAGRRVNVVVQLAHIDRWLDSLDQTPGVSVRRWGPFTVVSDRRS